MVAVVVEIGELRWLAARVEVGVDLHRYAVVGGEWLLQRSMDGATRCRSTTASKNFKDARFLLNPIVPLQSPNLSTVFATSA